MLRALSSSPSSYVIGAGIVLVYLIRIFPLFLHPSLFAEEGSVFFPRIVNGDHDIFHTGYMQTFAYLGIWLGYKISPTFLPHIVTAIAALVQVIPFLYFLRTPWESLLAFRYRVAFVFFALCLGPYHEGLGTILHSYFYMGLGTCFLLLEIFYLPKEARRYRKWKFTWTLVGGLSGPAVAIASIAFFCAHGLVRLFSEGQIWETTKKYLKQIFREPLVAAILTPIVLQVILSFTQPPAHTQDRFQNLFAIPQAVLHHLHMRGVMAFLSPLKFLQAINHSRELSLASLLVSLPLVYLALTPRTDLRRRSFTLTLLGTACLTVAVVFVARPFFFNLFRKSLWNVCLLGDRYNIVPGNLFFLACICILAQSSELKMKKIILSLFIPALVITGASRFFAESDSHVITPWKQVVTELNEMKHHKRERLAVEIRSKSMEISQR